MKFKKVDVKQEDIDKAKSIIERLEAGDCLMGSCPISQAIRRVYKKKVITDRHHCFINHKMYRLPDEARRFIASFDSGDDIEPFSFFVELVNV